MLKKFLTVDYDKVCLFTTEGNEALKFISNYIYMQSNNKCDVKLIIFDLQMPIININEITS